MTIALTIASSKRIYQCADYAITAIGDDKPPPPGAPKLFVHSKWGWSATICFSGLAKFGDIDIPNWIANKFYETRDDAPIHELIDSLLAANDWIDMVPEGNRRLSICVGAFVGSRPHFYLVSNHECLDRHGISNTPLESALCVLGATPNKVRIYVSGQKSSVTGQMRRRLTTLANSIHDPDEMYELMASVVSDISQTNDYVSTSCFTSHIDHTGKGAGRWFDHGSPVLNQPLSGPLSSNPVIQELMHKEFGKGRGRLKAIGFGRQASTKEEHEARLSEEPDDPNAHNNYGAFLSDVLKDDSRAEKAYRAALSLDPNHANALFNLALLLERAGNHSAARQYFESALRSEPGHQNCALHWSTQVIREHGDYDSAFQIIESAITARPDSHKLILRRGRLKLESGDPEGALEDIGAARQLGGAQGEIEASAAYAKHCAGRTAGECIKQYRTAISLNPSEGGLKLNLAQLLFIKSAQQEGKALVYRALADGLDDSAKLEAFFYLLAHCGDDAKFLLDEVRTILSAGNTLNWNVGINIEHVHVDDPDRASSLSVVAGILSGKANDADLAEIVGSLLG